MRHSLETCLSRKRLRPLCRWLAVLAVGMPATAVMSQERGDVKSGKGTTSSWSTKTTLAPKKAERQRQIPPLAQGRRALVPFNTAPFPYLGLVPATGKPFFEIQTEDRSGRRSRTGEVLWADVTYSDSRVLLDLPAGFNANRPGVLIVFLHGNGATLERDVIKRQEVPQQIAAAGLNSALVAPQFASDAPDSSAGTFWEKGALTAFLDEAALNLARLLGDVRVKPMFDRMPVVLVAYSGGYHPLAYLLQHGGSGDRILGVAVLDGIYGDQKRFAEWIARNPRSFFVVAYGPSSQDGTAELARLIAEQQVAVSIALGPELRDGVTLMQVPQTVVHNDFVTSAWIERPLRDLMRRVPGFPRQAKP